MHLDARSVPAAAVSGVRSGSGSPVAADPVDAQDGRDQPQDGTEEGERLVGLPGRAVVVAETDVAPVEGATTGVAEPVDDQAEGDEPADRDDEVSWPVNEAAAEGEQPDDGQEDGQAGDDLGVDEATQLPGRGTLGIVQVLAGEASDDGCEGQLWMESVHCLDIISFKYKGHLPPQGGESSRTDQLGSFWRLGGLVWLWV